MCLLNLISGVIFRGTLESNIIPVTLDANVVVYRTGLDFGGEMSRRMRFKLASEVIAKLLDPRT